jgi:hypothetical protein
MYGRSSCGALRLGKSRIGVIRVPRNCNMRNRGGFFEKIKNVLPQAPRANTAVDPISQSRNIRDRPTVCRVTAAQ